jgi:hypothetical protein
MILWGTLAEMIFIVIFQSDDWEARCNKILQAVAVEMPNFYDEKDRFNGGLSGEDRQGHQVHYPYISLSIGAVRVRPNQYKSQHEISSAVSHAKKEAKKVNGNCLFVERRERKV